MGCVPTRPCRMSCRYSSSSLASSRWPGASTAQAPGDLRETRLRRLLVCARPWVAAPLVEAMTPVATLPPAVTEVNKSDPLLRVLLYRRRRHVRAAPLVTRDHRFDDFLGIVGDAEELDVVRRDEPLREHLVPDPVEHVVPVRLVEEH